MKGHLKLLKSLDNKLNAAYASAQKSFCLLYTSDAADEL